MNLSRPTGSTRLATNLVLATLFLSTFVLGSAELLVVGVLDLLAGDLHVSISTAGTVVTSYALGLAIGGPLLAAATIRLERAALLRAALAAYLVVTVGALTWSSFSGLVLARLVAGAIHGLVVGVAFTIATSIVPAQRTGRAIATVIGGFAVSTAVGVPLGTLVGRSLGWRGSYLAVAALGVLVLGATALLVPSVPASAGGGTRVRQALAPPVLAVLGLATLLFTGQYVALTYIVPFLTERTGVSGTALSAFLLAYGAATAVGVFGGGRLADQSAARTIVLGNAVLVLALGGLHLLGAVPALAAVALVVWGTAGLGLVPSVQYRVVSLAGSGRDLAATLPASAINAGIALGSLLGGWSIARHGASAPVVAGTVICALALPISWATGLLRLPPAAAPGGCAADPDRAGAAPTRDG